ncbi:MFS transporter [Clostridium sp. CF012]|uniref:MFS transporter n=1 Tax=Clostridium sp. CF012 TaxID=2843319 RepID=UPI001C0D0D7D|nr:MFS transporter [Clostridium sp. CF012]MBU3145687.1 MFS transporter [Clostridium sp. CF012]
MKKLDYKKVFLLGIGFFAISVTWSIYNAFVPKILSNFISSTTIIGFIMTIDNYFALFLQPAVGILSDKIDTKHGKRMPFIMIGMPLSVVFIILVANYKNLPMLITFIVLMNLSMSIFRSPVVALMPDITAKENRSKANSIINLMGGIGSVIAYIVGSKLWDLDEKYPFYLAAILMCFSFILLFNSIKERRDVAHYEKDEAVNKGFVKSIKEALKNKSVMFLLLAICSWFIGFAGIETLFTLYGEKYLGIKTSAAAFSFTFISIAFLISAIPAGILGTKFGKKKTITAGIVGIVVSFFIIAFMKNILYIRGMFLICGFFWALININSYPFVTDMAPKGKIGTFTGLYYLTASVAAIISPPLLGLIIDLLGYKYMFFYGAVFFLIAIILINKVKIESLE